ncbi:hypothetical protein V6767_20375 [Martelella sp. FLE1502]
MAKAVKLTAPQYYLLVEISDNSRNVVDSYKPAQKLVALGFAELGPSSFGARNLSITDAGRQHLKEKTE